MERKVIKVGAHSGFQMERVKANFNTNPKFLLPRNKVGLSLWNMRKDGNRKVIFLLDTTDRLLCFDHGQIDEEQFKLEIIDNDLPESIRHRDGYGAYNFWENVLLSPDIPDIFSKEIDEEGTTYARATWNLISSEDPTHIVGVLEVTNIGADREMHGFSEHLGETLEYFGAV